MILTKNLFPTTFFFVFTIFLSLNVQARILLDSVVPSQSDPQIIADFSLVKNGSITFSDIDGDGDQDIFITGEDLTTCSFIVKVVAFDCPELEVNNGDPCIFEGQSGEYEDCECLGYDCNEVPGGTASIDNCGLCSGGTTGNVQNESCTDCAGVLNGTASLDYCGICSGGTTGVEPNALCSDCNDLIILECPLTESTYIYDEGVVSTSIYQASCLPDQGASFLRDLWFTFNADGNTEFSFEASQANFGLIVYSGTCGNLEIYDCAESQDNTSTYWVPFFSTGVVPAGQYFIQVLNYSDHSNEEANIVFHCLEIIDWDCSVTLDSIEIGTCLDDDGFVNVSMSGTTNMQSVLIEFQLDGNFLAYGSDVNEDTWEVTFNVQGDMINGIMVTNAYSEGGCSIYQNEVFTLPEITCVDPSLLDCNGDFGGIAYFDDCGVCSGGNTGLTPNESCKDCEGVINGDALSGSICYNGNDIGTYNFNCECISNDVGSLNGHVVGLSDCGLRNITISIYNEEYPQLNDVFTTIVNANGDFTTPTWTTGVYSILIKIDGCLARLYPDETIVSGINPLMISAIVIGDINNSNNINLGDVSSFNAAFGSINGDVNYNSLADLNCDGLINILDVSILNSNFGKVGDGVPANISK